jgi:hypothetical protein
MYKVLIRPVLTYASETWTLSKTNEWQLGLFERRVLRFIFRAKQGNGTWRKRYNHELYELFNDSNTVNYIKAKILTLAGHLICMSNERTLKKVFNTKPEGTRSVGRPKLGLLFTGSCSFGAITSIPDFSMHITTHSGTSVNFM